MVNTHLVTWQEFLKEKENKNLPIMEAKAKYLKLQRKFNLLMEAEVAAYNAVALNSVTHGSQGGDPSLVNPIKNIFFSDIPTKIEDGNDPVAITLVFQYPVLVTGNPAIKIANGQQGGGTENNIVLAYDSGTGTDTLVFNSTQVSANVDGDQPIGAGKLLVGQDIASIVVQGITGINAAGTTTGVSGVAAAAGGGAGTAQQDVVLTIVNDVAGNFDSATITSIASTSTAYYNVGDTITVAASELSAVGGSGGSAVFTITNATLTGDTLGIPRGIEIVENPGTVSSPSLGTIAFDATNFITLQSGEKIGYENYMTYSNAIVGGNVNAEADG
tara:strand:- start:889 stop:1878 length:990 start_codon:yes stop_codon:yes gene_type:complete